MLPCFCIARTFYPADSVPPAFLWPGATVGWVGAPKFVFQAFAHEGSSISLPAALKPLHCNLLVWGRMARQDGDFVTASGPGSTIPRFSFFFAVG